VPNRALSSIRLQVQVVFPPGNPRGDFPVFTELYQPKKCGILCPTVMKLLLTSSDAGAVGSLVERLIGAGILCAVFRDLSDYTHLRVWVRQDTDLSAAVPLLPPPTGEYPLPDLGATALLHQTQSEN
jgi:hypothetical protein